MLASFDASVDRATDHLGLPRFEQHPPLRNRYAGAELVTGHAADRRGPAVAGRAVRRRPRRLRPALRPRHLGLADHADPRRDAGPGRAGRAARDQGRAGLTVSAPRSPPRGCRDRFGPGRPRARHPSVRYYPAGSASGAGEEVGRGPGVDRLLDDRPTGARGVDHLAVADVEAHVVDRARVAARAPEHQVAGRQLGGGDARRAGELRDRVVRQVLPALGPGARGEARAVPGVRAGGAPPVGVADLGGREGDRRRGAGAGGRRARGGGRSARAAGGAGAGAVGSGCRGRGRRAEPGSSGPGWSAPGSSGRGWWVRASSASGCGRRGRRLGRRGRRRRVGSVALRRRRGPWSARPAGPASWPPPGAACGGGLPAPPAAAASCAACSAASWAAACSAASWAAFAAASAAACSSADWRFSASRTLMPWRSASSAMSAVLDAAIASAVAPACASAAGGVGAGLLGLRLEPLGVGERVLGLRAGDVGQRGGGAERVVRAVEGVLGVLHRGGAVDHRLDAVGADDGGEALEARGDLVAADERVAVVLLLALHVGRGGLGRGGGRARRPAGLVGLPARPVVGLGRLGRGDGGLAQPLVGHDEVGLDGGRRRGPCRWRCARRRRRPPRSARRRRPTEAVVTPAASTRLRAAAAGQRSRRDEVRRTAWCGCRQGWHRCFPSALVATGDFPFTRDTRGTLVLTSPNGNNFPNLLPTRRRVDLTNYKVVIRVSDRGDTPRTAYLLGDSCACWPLQRPASDKVPARAGTLTGRR